MWWIKLPSHFWSEVYTCQENQKKITKTVMTDDGEDGGDDRGWWWMMIDDDDDDDDDILWGIFHILNWSATKYD